MDPVAKSLLLLLEYNMDKVIRAFRVELELEAEVEVEYGLEPGAADIVPGCKQVIMCREFTCL